MNYIFFPDSKAIQYNQQMFTTNQISDNVIKLLNQIRNSQSFKAYQQRQSGRGLFAAVKNTFEEMVVQLEKFIPRCGRESTDDIYTWLIAGRKIWAYYEFKMFAWIVAWLQFQKAHIHQTSFQAQMAVIEGIFPNKCHVFLRYEYLLLTSKSEKIKCIWVQEQVDNFAAIVKQFSELGQKKGNGLNWKFISFRLFNEFGFFKTPNECRERWSNHLNPKLNKTKWHPSEDLRLLSCYQQIGSKWAIISRKLKNRTQHMVKNRFNSLRHKWLKARKPNTIFNINLLIRQIKESVRCLEIKQEQQISERQLEPSNQEEEKPSEPMVKIEESPVDELSDHYPGSSAEEGMQAEESQKSEESAGIHPAALSLADVGGEVQVKRENKNTVDESMGRHICIDMLLEDPLWKDSDRVPTSDFDWLDEMIEERNIRYADEFL